MAGGSRCQVVLHVFVHLAQYGIDFNTCVIIRFKRLGQFRCLAPRIPYPKAGGVRLENKYYEVVLKTLLENPEDNQVRTRK